MREEKPLKLNEFYDFADFRLDLSEKTLSKNGEFVPLTPKSFETLLVLIENKGKILSKEELMQHIWRDSFVDENNLAFNIKTLRRTLGDDANHPTFIETIPRRGYRFIAQIKEDKPNNNSIGSVKTQTNYRQKLLLAAFSISVLIILALGVWIIKDKFFDRQSKIPILSKNFEAEKITSSGKVRLAVISPDGKYVAYSNILDGKTSIWLREIETGNNVELIAATQENYFGLEFSNDGDALYFVRDSDEKKEQPSIYRISIHGGIATKIVDETQGWISLSPDSKRLSFVRYNKAEEDWNALMTIDADGKNERKVAVRKRPFVFWTNDWSPDGQTIAVAVGNSENGGKDISLNEINLETGEEHPITAQKFYVIKDIQWLPDNTELLITAIEKAGGNEGIYQVSRLTGEITLLTKDSNNYRSLSLNNNADKLVTSQSQNDFYLYLGNLKDSANQKVFVKAQDKFVLTKSNKLIYTSDAGGNPDLWSINFDGSEQKQLTVEDGMDFSPILSNDGRYIYFTSNRTGEHQVWRMNSDGSNQKQITKNEGGYPLFVSPDGITVYYQNSKTKLVWKISLISGEETLFSEKLGSFYAFSPDGESLAYLSRDQGTKEVKISVVKTETKELLKTFPVPEKGAAAFCLKWAHEGKSLTYITLGKDKKDTGWEQALNEEKPKLISKLGQGVSDFSLTPDGQNFAFISGGWKHDAVLIKGLK